MVDLDTGGERAAAAGVLDLVDFGPVRMARMGTREVGHVVVGPGGHVASERERHHEHAARHVLPGVHVRDIPDQQMSRTDFHVVALVAQALEVGTTTYQLV